MVSLRLPNKQIEAAHRHCWVSAFMNRRLSAAHRGLALLATANKRLTAMLQGFIKPHTHSAIDATRNVRQAMPTQTHTDTAFTAKQSLHYFHMAWLPPYGMSASLHVFHKKWIHKSISYWYNMISSASIEMCCWLIYKYTYLCINKILLYNIIEYNIM